MTCDHADFFDPSILPEGFDNDLALCKWIQGMKFQRELLAIEKAEHESTFEQVDWRCEEINFALDGTSRCQVRIQYSMRSNLIQADAETTLCDCAELRANNRLVRYSLPSHSDLDEGEGIPVVMMFHGWTISSITSFRTEDDYYCQYFNYIYQLII